MIGDLISSVNLEDTTISILADHTTSTEQRKHTLNPPPVAIISKAIGRDHTKKFTEKEALKGGLERIKSSCFISQLLKRPEKK